MKFGQMTSDYPLRHGYTMADVHELARKAAGANRFFGTDAVDRYEDAWHAIVEHLLTADERPEEYDLALAGRKAIWSAVKAYRRSYGYLDEDHAAGACMRPRFAEYWMPRATRFEDGVVEEIALVQILAALSERDVEVLLAYASTGDSRAAAAVTRYTQSTYSLYLQQARRRVRALWHEGETPPPTPVIRPYSRYDGSDLAPCGTHGAYERHLRRKEYVDDACLEAGREYERMRWARRKANAPVSQPEEEAVLNTDQCGFDPRRGHESTVEGAA